MIHSCVTRIPVKTVGASQGWDKSDNIFLGSIATHSSNGERERERFNRSTRTYVSPARGATHTRAARPPFISLFTSYASNANRSEDPNNESTLRSLLFFEKWRNTGGTSDVLPEDSSLRSRIFVLRFFLLHPSLFIIVSSFCFIPHVLFLFI